MTGISKIAQALGLSKTAAQSVEERSAREADQKNAGASGAAPADSVEISREALSYQDARASADSARAQIESTGQTIGADTESLKALV